MKQHTQNNGNFKPTNDGCAGHKTLSIHSGCTDAIASYSSAFEELLNVAKNTEFNNFKYNYDIDINNPQKDSFEAWANDLN